jgi:RNA polymerase sigma factor FliA
MRMSAREAELAARNGLVVANIDMVKSVARRLAQRLPPQVEVPDLVGAGVIGLIEAAGRYKAATGVPFDAFARRRIQGAMLDALRDLDWAPRSLRKLRRDRDAACARLRHDLGRDPVDEEIRRAMGMSSADYARSLEQLRLLERGNARTVDEQGAEGRLLELCLDPSEGPEVRLQRAELSRFLARALEQLPERERRILAMYYHEEMTLAAIGRVIGVGESRVSQLRALAVTRLRGILADLLGTKRQAA